MSFTKQKISFRLRYCYLVGPEGLVRLTLSDWRSFRPGPLLRRDAVALKLTFSQSSSAFDGTLFFKSCMKHIETPVTLIYEEYRLFGGPRGT